MDPEDPIGKRIDAATQRLVRFYLAIRMTLRLIPIPIGLPEDPDSSGDMVLAVQRARELMEEEPMDGGLAALLETILLDWLNAYELGVLIQLAGPAPWRLDAMEAAIDRGAEYAKVPAEMLGVILDDEEQAARFPRHAAGGTRRTREPLVSFQELRNRARQRPAVAGYIGSCRALDS